MRGYLARFAGVTSSRPLHLSTLFMCISFANFLFFISFKFVYLQCQSQTTWTRYTDKMSDKMENAKFSTVGQNVYVTFTTSGSRVISELYCIAVNIETAEKLASLLNECYN